MERRSFLKLLSGGVLGSAFSNLLSVRKKTVEYVYSYVVPPVGVIPGVANWYSTVCRQCPSGCGIQVRLREGRAKKIEGNPDFPLNYGRVCARGQAGLQTLYNPDRLTGPKMKTDEGFKDITWDEALDKLAAQLKVAKGKDKKDNVAFITDPLRGNVSALITTFFTALGTGEIISYGILDDEGLAVANEKSFGQSSLPDYDISNSTFVLSLGTQFMDTWASPVKHAVGYGRMRDREQGKGERGTMVQFEPRLSVTGAGADEWYPIAPGTEGLLALSIANVIVEEKLADSSVESELSDWEEALRPYSPKKIAHETGVTEETIVKVAKEFAHAEEAVAICAGGATAQVNGVFNAVAGNILNHLVGSVGKDGGVKFTAPSFFNDRLEKGSTYADVRELSRKMTDREIDILFVNNTNPAFTLPKRAGFNSGLREVSMVVSLSNVIDETSAKADLILPDLHFLESWGDYVAPVDSGNKSIGLMQPVVAPVQNGRSLGDIFLQLASLIGGDVAAALPATTFEQYLKDAWQTLYNNGRERGVIHEDTFEKFWDVSLGKGGWWEEKSAHREIEKRPEPDLLKEVRHKKDSDERREFYLEIYPSTAYDGRGANQPWLQQLPTPLVTAAWGSWAQINPETARELEIEEGDVIEINSAAGSIKVPAFFFPAIHPKTIAIPMGQGHTSYGRFADGYGVNPMILVDKVDSVSGAPAWASTKVEIAKKDEKEEIVKTDPVSDQPGMENGPVEMDREIVQWISPEEDEKLVGHDSEEPIKALPTRDLRKGPHFLSSIGLAKYRKSQYHDYKYRWGMVIDLDKCTGCSACMVACNAENNLMVTNAEQLGRGRHKNWIRVDRYWEGEYPNIRAKVIPINCGQCGNAPCEPVCPVYASFHTADGLNGQVYPRCVGTRYCNAACPYKARRFNWTGSEWPEPLNQQINTDVSVRFAGVTEKCTFCVQRIRAAKDTAKDKNGSVADGTIQPACMQTCPSGAITFGDLLDPSTKVSKMTKSYRRYRVLEELNTEPAVIYLKAVRTGAEGEGHGEGERGSSEH